jgi:3-hydroxyisobutyrate dehydrogenase-like beta-hydroxyacid dehydrogenase
MLAGHEVTVYNRTPEKAETLREHGARVATSPAEAVRGAEAVFTMLSDDQTESDVTLGDKGIASGLSAGAFHIASSAISVAFARKLQEEHGKAGSRVSERSGRRAAASGGRQEVGCHDGRRQGCH